MADLMFRYAKEHNPMMNGVVATQIEESASSHMREDVGDIEYGILVSQFAPCEFQNTPHPFQTTTRSLKSFMEQNLSGNS